MRTNLKIIGAVLFTMVLFVGGFLLNTTKSEAANFVQSYGISYSMSPIISSTNTDGTVTTKVLVGCAHNSGDEFDVNTGMRCYNNIKTVLTGCAVGSRDIFDVNNGRPCASYIKPVLVGCALKSGDMFDINTGNSCKNKVSIATQKPSSTSVAKPISKATQINPITNNILNTIPTNGEENSVSGREKLKDSLAASVERAGSIMKGPMSIWIILLIIAILLGGGYGVYSFKTKDETETTMGTTPTEKKEEVIKTQPVKPAAQEAKVPTPEIAHANVNQVNTQVPPIHTAQNPAPQEPTAVK